MLGQSELAGPRYDIARRERSRLRRGAPDRCFVLRNRGPFTADIITYTAMLRSGRRSAGRWSISRAATPTWPRGAPNWRSSTTASRFACVETFTTLPRSRPKPRPCWDATGRLSALSIPLFPPSLRMPRCTVAAPSYGWRLAGSMPPTPTGADNSNWCRRNRHPCAPAWRCAWPTTKRRCPSCNGRSKRSRPIPMGSSIA